MKAPQLSRNNQHSGLRPTPPVDRTHVYVQQPESPICDLCQTEDYLVYEHVRMITGPDPAAPPVWEVDCWCGQCETFYGYRTTHPPKDPYVVRSALKVRGLSTAAGSFGHY